MYINLDLLTCSIFSWNQCF